MILSILLHDGNKPWEHLVIWGIILAVLVVWGIAEKRDRDRAFRDKQLKP